MTRTTSRPQDSRSISQCQDVRKSLCDKHGQVFRVQRDYSPQRTPSTQSFLWVLKRETSASSDGTFKGRTLCI